MNKLLFPKNIKYKKQHKFKIKSMKNPKLIFGTIGLFSNDKCLINSNQIEACRKTILRYTKRVGKIKINVFPDNTKTKKSEGSRMGGGKGNHLFWSASVSPGKLIFELKGIPFNVALHALQQVRYKIPFKTTIFYEKF